MVRALDQAGIDFMVAQEGLVLHPYFDVAKIATIGIGNTYYESGQAVKITDPAITLERAKELFINTSKQFADPVHFWTKPVLNQNQFNALFSLCYNIGTGGFRKSTVLSLINQGITDARLKGAFQAWCHANGEVNHDLWERRTKEYELYIS